MFTVRSGQTGERATLVFSDLVVNVDRIEPVAVHRARA